MCSWPGIRLFPSSILQYTVAKTLQRTDIEIKKVNFMHVNEEEKLVVEIHSSSENFTATFAHSLTALANICAGKIVE